MLMVKEQQEILDELVKVSIQFFHSRCFIVNITTIFYVPGAISLILLVVTSIGTYI
jgi:hypothetical protein